MYIPPLPEKDEGFWNDPILRGSNILLIAFIGALLLFVFPLGFLSQLIAFQIFLDTATNAIPSLADWLNASEFKEETGLYLMFLLAALPVQAVAVVKNQKVKTYIDARETLNKSTDLTSEPLS